MEEQICKKPWRLGQELNRSRFIWSDGYAATAFARREFTSRFSVERPGAVDAGQLGALKSVTRVMKGRTNAG